MVNWSIYHYEVFPFPWQIFWSLLRLINMVSLALFVLLVFVYFSYSFILLFYWSLCIFMYKLDFFSITHNWVLLFFFNTLIIWLLVSAFANFWALFLQTFFFLFHLSHLYWGIQLSIPVPHFILLCLLKIFFLCISFWIVFIYSMSFFFSCAVSNLLLISLVYYLIRWQIHRSKKFYELQCVL